MIEVENHHKEKMNGTGSMSLDENETDEEIETDDEEDDHFASDLLDKSLLKQHSVAILIAIVGAMVSHFHLIPSLSDGYGNQFSENSFKFWKRERTLKNINVGLNQYHQSYRRTDDIKFCPYEEYLSPDETHYQRVQRVMFKGKSERTNHRNLQLFQFNLPKEYLDVMGSHYLADNLKDDNYTLISNSNEMKNIQNDEFQCLLSTYQSLPKSRSNIQATIPIYVQPPFSTFFQKPKSSATPPLSVKDILKDNNKIPGLSDKKKSLTPSHTGFAAKFINMSAKPLNLYWDGASTSHPKTLIGTIQPFEAIGTATFPGTSFYVAPTYDKEYSLQRWLVTADNTVLVYNPYNSDSGLSSITLNEKIKKELTDEQFMKYKMQLLNIAYGREYLAVTRRSWLGNFPKPIVMHHMWDAEYFGQEFVVSTRHSHFMRMPKENELQRLSVDGYKHYIEDKNQISLAQYRAHDALQMKIRAISIAPRVFEVDNFLSSVEVQHFLELSTKYNITMEESTLTPGLADGTSNERDAESKYKKDKKTRSSTNAWIHREFSPITDAVYSRVADLLKIDDSLLRHRGDYEQYESSTLHSIAEAMQLVHYGPGQQYTAHHDFLYPSVVNRYQPSRFVTVLLYLNDVESGGETVFPRAMNDVDHDGIKVKPKSGKAIFFYNVLPDGNFDDLSQHASLPIDKNNEKWVANLWVWDPVID